MLSELEVDFLRRLWRGDHPGLADREADKARQRVRRMGLAKVVMNPRRWVLTDDGRALFDPTPAPMEGKSQ
jgi:hypothetical protein